MTICGLTWVFQYLFALFQFKFLCREPKLWNNWQLTNLIWVCHFSRFCCSIWFCWFGCTVCKFSFWLLTSFMLLYFSLIINKVWWRQKDKLSKNRGILFKIGSILMTKNYIHLETTLCCIQNDLITALSEACSGILCCLKSPLNAGLIKCAVRQQIQDFFFNRTWQDVSFDLDYYGNWEKVHVLCDTKLPVT